MNRKLGNLQLIILLVSISALLYLISVIVFARPSETVFYFLQDLAFIPLSVLLVTLGVNTVLIRRERQSKLEKVGIVINEFFTEAGTELILALSPFIVNLEEISARLQPGRSWQEKDFSDRVAYLEQHKLTISTGRSSLDDLHLVLRQKREHILRLFENANLLENDRFTDMLWAVYHVYDELHSRSACNDLPDSDLRHLDSDIQRAAQLLLVEWVEYMRLLKKRYPYLYSLAIRKGLFGNQDPIVHE
jgi:hypothetical protein